MPGGSETARAAAELRSVGAKLRAAVNSQDAEGALSLLSCQMLLLQSAMAAGCDTEFLRNDSLAVLHSCLHMAQAHRQEAVGEYARFAALPNFHDEELRRGGTIVLHG